MPRPQLDEPEVFPAAPVLDAEPGRASGDDLGAAGVEATARRDLGRVRRVTGQERPREAADAEAEFARVYLPQNAAGPRRERWFHALGCRTWFTVRRDTTTNGID